MSAVTVCIFGRSEKTSTVTRSPETTRWKAEHPENRDLNAKRQYETFHTSLTSNYKCDSESFIIRCRSVHKGFGSISVKKKERN